MSDLRPYQQVAADAVLNYFFDNKQKKPVLVVIPTAGGKSHVIAYVARRLDAPLLIFQPSIEILKQNYDKLILAGAMGVSVYSASAGRKEMGNITLATIGSVYNNEESFRHYKYVIVDECHLFSAKPSMYRQFFDIVGSKMVGFSATPWRQSTNGFGTEMRFLTRTKPKVFSKVIHVTQIRELLDMGFLCKVQYYSLSAIDRSQIQLNTTGADYDEESERKYYDKIEYDQKILDIVNRILKVGKTSIIVFTKFVKESLVLSEKLGSNARYVSGEMPIKERTQNINDFRAGKYKVLCNVGVTKLGYDHPSLQVVIDTCPTRSLTNYMQKVGRVMRPHPDKQEAWYVDMGGNVPIFGKVEDMQIVEDGKNIWSVVANGKQLTNVYYDEIMKD